MPRRLFASFVKAAPQTRESLLKLLGRAAHIRCLGSYMSGEDALKGIPLEKPDVALVDLNLPGISGVECVAKLKVKLPGLRIVILTTYKDTARIFDSLRAGASGYLLKKAGCAGLVQAIDETLCRRRTNVRPGGAAGGRTFSSD